MKKATVLLIMLPFGILCAQNQVDSTRSLKLDSLSKDTLLLEEFFIMNLCHCADMITVYDMGVRPNDSVGAGFSRSRPTPSIDSFSHNFLSSNVSYSTFSYPPEDFYGSNKVSLNDIVDVYSSSAFNRLDSLYYKPLVQEFFNRSEYPRFMADHSTLYECYEKIKEIDLETEFSIFLNEQLK